MNNEEIKQKILDSIEYATNTLGFTLVQGNWGSSENKCACALGCVILKNGLEILGEGLEEDNAIVAAELLGKPKCWIDDFINGFDSDEIGTYHEGWKIGNEIKNITEPVEI